MPYTKEAAALIDRDEDKDGLKDWEEVLWKTNPKEKDSDYDGTNDPDEIAAKRDPARAGPDDALANPFPRASDTPADTENLTVTERLGREFFATYLAARQSGEPVTSESMRESIETLVGTAASTETAPTYSSADLTISTQKGTAAVKAYGNNMGDIVIRYSPKDIKEMENELALFSRAIQTQKYAELEKLDVTVEGYTRIIRDALALPIPQEVSPLHLRLINAMSAYKETVAGLRNAERDPVLGLVAMGNYKKHFLGLYNAILDTGKYFDAQGVRFGGKEGGAIFKPL